MFGSLLLFWFVVCGVVVEFENQQGCIDGGNDILVESYGFFGQVDMKIGIVMLSLISVYCVFIGCSNVSDVDNVLVNCFNFNVLVGDY